MALSLRVGIPNGRIFPFGFGIYTRGIAWCFQLLISLSSSAKFNLSLWERELWPSTPAVFFPILSWVTCRTARYREHAEPIIRLCNFLHFTISFSREASYNLCCRRKSVFSNSFQGSFFHSSV